MDGDGMAALLNRIWAAVTIGLIVCISLSRTLTTHHIEEETQK
jgi:hypothetical protein